MREFTDFGSNPGNLRARVHMPAQLPPKSALVVVLHGCTQTAQGFDRGAGWSQLADEAGFALLFPEQQRSNNANLCFNWFEPQDTKRGSGEALSIAQMVRALVKAEDLDDRRVFITGLSAGGAMTSVMLATYPEIFAGGAIVAGLPYGAATGMSEALAQMRAPSRDGTALGARVRNASKHQGPWPRLSIWHGTADHVVAPANAAAILAQWQAVLGSDGPADVTEVVDGHRRQVWRDRDGQNAIESFSVAGMGHGVPLAASGEDACGHPGPYMLEAGISSTRHIARFWGIVPAASAGASRSASASVTSVDAVLHPRPSRLHRIDPPKTKGVGSIIEDALRAAGLMR